MMNKPLLTGLVCTILLATSILYGQDRSTTLTTGRSTTLTTGRSTTLTTGKPLKVYILAGQSNMVGTGSVKTFPAIGFDPETAPMLKDMQNEAGKPVVCDNVYITWPTGKDNKEKHGKLTVGFASSKGGTKIGPEFTFGITMHKMTGEPILLIKTAWGGKDLINQFRPPSAGKEKPEGEYYVKMMKHVKNVLADPKRVCPLYNPEAGYEVAGFVWFQGYNDFIGGGYPLVDESKGKKSAKDYSEHSRLLACFIRDIRKELSAPKLPFVIGVFGMGGKTDSPNILNFRKAQAATAEMSEFKGNVVNVFTENYWPARLQSLLAKEKELMSGKVTLEGEAAEIMKALKAAQKRKSAGDKSTRKKAWKEVPVQRARLLKAYFPPDDATLVECGASNQGYHYYGSAKFYAQAGKAFAEALVNQKKTK